MKIQTRATLLFSALTSLVILVFCGSIYLFTNHYAFEDFYRRLETRVIIASDLHLHLNSNTDKELVRQMRQAYLEKLPGEKEYLLEVPQETALETLQTSELPEPLLREALAKQSARYRANRTFYAGKLEQANDKTYLVVVSAHDPYWLEEVEKLYKFLLIGFLLSVGIVYVIGRKFTAHTFNPVREIIKNVQGISVENLNQRLEVDNNKDELAELAQTFNGMLTRLETAFETQNNFVSNASHELRTPLTIIKGEAELTLASAGLTSGQRQSLEVILHEADVLRDILTSLLGMAQSGFDGKKQNWEQVRIDELLWLVKESTSQLYPGCNIRLDFSQMPTEEELLLVYGNVNLLKLAIGNIVMNACKYSHNQEVVLSIQSEQTLVAVVVRDKGIGIPEQELPHIFVPFFRASNTSEFEGHGVGLPLSLNIVRLHKGSIVINTQVGAGTEIKVLLPTVEAAGQ
ncbi:sensor histidine kinase [Rufibacter roseus]|uniref:histidine kinase n=1 Tax=Rufibacter roseus TaxID=1567108 RepID=A0ABW2DHZ2_9BACT|nr:HAMP domain-containing sensor histidine kinase [Rufibacter roseus]